MKIISEKFAVTRKVHQCQGCLKKFPVGTRMHIQSIVDGGDMWSWRTCEQCHDMQVHIFSKLPLNDRPDEIGPGFSFELCGYNDKYLQDNCLCNHHKSGAAE